jgi:predicted phage terminase large subunit-like protein
VPRLYSSDTNGDDTVDKQRQQLAAAKRLLAIREAQEKLLPFMRLTMPDPSDIDDPYKSLYEITPQAKLLCEVVEKIERRELKRVAVAISPQMGKSQVLTRGGPAWISGRDPRRHIMVGAYNQTFAAEFGDDVRNIMGSPLYRSVFPRHALRKGATDLLITEDDGKLAFVGVGGSGTGKPADFFFVDDPIRNDEDAQSAAYREKLWKWFNRVVFTRCHGETPILVVHTRWHEDDLIGRLCDPEHPERNKSLAGIAEDWTYINIPAVVSDPKLAAALGLTLQPQTDARIVDQFGRKPIAALWPRKFPLRFLAEAKRLDPQGFSSLRMGKPTPEDGSYFRQEDLVEYDVGDLPPKEDLRFYGASDHAVSKKQDRDATVLGCVGVDSDDNLWVLPDVVMERMETDKTVDEMLIQFKTHKPLLWWMESELISKSFGPFLRKRMEEERAYTSLDDVLVSKDKSTRARSIQGRMRMRKVRFPRFAPWWPEARAQILRFPNGAHDDFVDWLAHIGQGLIKEVGAAPPKQETKNEFPVGSIQWILRNAKARAKRDNQRKHSVAW